MKRTLPIDPATVSEVRRAYATGDGREWRLARGLSLREIAEPTGISVPTLWKIEKGLRVPRAQTAMKLAPVLASLLKLEMEDA